MTVATRCSEENLVGLFRGDEDTTGYIHSGLVRELCRYWKPKAVGELVERLYPGETIADQPAHVRLALNEGLKLWRREN